MNTKIKKILAVIICIALVGTLGVTTVSAVSDYTKFQVTDDEKAEMQKKLNSLISQQVKDSATSRKFFFNEFFEKEDIIGIQFNDEQKAAIQTKINELLEKGLADGKISQELYDVIISAIENGEMPKLNEKHKTEIMAILSEFVMQITQFTDGVLPQEFFDTITSALENVKIPELNDELIAELKDKISGYLGQGMFENGFSLDIFDSKMPVLTDEKKIEMQSIIQEFLSKALDDGLITQEQYDEIISAIENGNMPDLSSMNFPDWLER